MDPKIKNDLTAFPLNHCKQWCPGADLNHRHADFQSAALPLSYPGVGKIIRGAWVIENKRGAVQHSF